jgi:AcrR family transcriptional regulator
VFPLRDPDATRGEASGRRQQKKLATRAALNQAALTLFASNGYERTTVDDLCREANVSLRTFFRYFESKDDVLFARQMDIGPFLAALGQVGTDVPPFAAIGHAYLTLPRLSTADVEQAVLFHRAMADSAVLQGRYVAGMEYFRRQVAAALARRDGRRAPTDTDVLAAILGQATLDHAYRRWLARDARGSLRASVEHSFDDATALLTASSSPVALARPT